MLDLKYAYSQFKLAADLARQFNVNIVRGNATGTYRFLTWFYGLADMSAEFQKAIDRTINQAENTFCCLDDNLIVSKRDESDHEKLVEKVLKTLNKENLTLKKFKNQIDWLGHHLSESWVTPKFTQTEAIQNLHPPLSLKQLRSFLGKLNHLAKFIPNAASLTNKFRPFLREEVTVKNLEWGMNTQSCLMLKKFSS